MTNEIKNNGVPFEIINALNEFESYGLESIHKTDSSDRDFNGIHVDEYLNDIYVQFDQLRGDIYNYFETTTETKS